MHGCLTYTQQRIGRMTRPRRPHQTTTEARIYQAGSTPCQMDLLAYLRPFNTRRTWSNGLVYTGRDQLPERLSVIQSYGRQKQSWQLKRKNCNVQAVTVKMVFFSLLSAIG